MAQIKTAITVPEAVLAEIDRAARARGESRSKYITRLLQAAASARRDVEITRRLNAIFASEPLAASQQAETAAMDEVGTNWGDERW